MFSTIENYSLILYSKSELGKLSRKKTARLTKKVDEWCINYIGKYKDHF